MSRDLPQQVREIGEALENDAGGYLRNTVRDPGAVCQVCCTPWTHGDRCNQCRPQYLAFEGELADRVASMVYAEKRTLSGNPGQTYLALFGYKATPPQAKHTELIEALLGLGIIGHLRCAHWLSGQRNILWAIVPSTRRPGLAPPIQKLVRDRFHRGFEVDVRVRRGAQKSRTIEPDNFAVYSEIPSRTHVAVIDDTWVTGGSAQSVAVALRAAGATSISILTVGRVLSPEFGANADFMRSEYWKRDFDYRVCPWTGGECPR